MIVRRNCASKLYPLYGIFTICDWVPHVHYIIVTFNNMTGLGHRQTAYTCDATIVLSISYANYDDFKAILNSTEEKFSWGMDCL